MPKYRRRPEKKQRKWIAKQSARRRTLMEKYRAQRALFLASKCCAVCLKECKDGLRNSPKWARDVHHMMGRMGSLLMDRRHWLAVCRKHHNWIHDNPKEAEKNGWIDLKNWNRTD